MPLSVSCNQPNKSSHLPTSKLNFILGFQARRRTAALVWAPLEFNSENDRWPNSREETNQLPTVLDLRHGQRNTTAEFYAQSGTDKWIYAICVLQNQYPVLLHSDYLMYYTYEHAVTSTRDVRVRHFTCLSTWKINQYSWWNWGGADGASSVCSIFELIYL